ncbi:GNAT family N-acetyltransferase [Anaerotalea alkaliphila]|uniref:GNAT family N-acetyltransferase n=1 Tax=Anaerotalea alkaliphila TaxID=2662126 RepID=A0A7X5HXG7_9FIRM|nr:GNAT family protein [Anaerotalea alkaliphila]NDL68291.1 GNAT family N-acetyltransferase [Anaerotalea alkaliphila]
MDLRKVLVGDRTALRPVEPEDKSFILSHLGDEGVYQHIVNREPIATLEEAEAYIDAHMGGDRQNRWVIELLTSKQKIGTIGFYNLDRQNHTAGISYDLSRMYWHQGIMSEVLGIVIAYGLEDLGLNRIEALVHLENLPAYYALRKKGFVAEGIIREAYYSHGKYHDHYLMSILQGQAKRRN